MLVKIVYHEDMQTRPLKVRPIIELYGDDGQALADFPCSEKLDAREAKQLCVALVAEGHQVKEVWTKTTEADMPFIETSRED